MHENYEYAPTAAAAATSPEVTGNEFMVGQLAQTGGENTHDGRSDVSPRLVVYVGRLNIVVDNISSALKSIRNMADALGGYTQEMGLNWITIKVPVARFEETVAKVEELGEVTEREIRSTDVTDQMRDMKIRLDNAQEFRKRLLKLLEKTVKIEDALKIEKELERITETIEILKGKIKYLEHSVAYSTLKVKLNSPMPQQKISIKIPFDWVRKLGTDLTRPGTKMHNPGLSSWRSIDLELPKSYVLYYRENYRIMAMSADYTMIKVKRHENYEGGSLEFWYKLIRRQLVEGMAFSIKGESDLTLDTKAKAKMAVAIKELGRETYGYLVAVIVTNDYVYTYEAWGQERNLSADRTIIEKSIKSMKIGP